MHIGEYETAFPFLSFLFRFPRPKPPSETERASDFDRTIIALSSPAPDSLTKLCRSTKNKLTDREQHPPSESQSLLFSQSLPSHPPPCIPFLSLLTLVFFPFYHLNHTFKPCLRSMTSVAPTKTQLLARWRGIEEEDDTGDGIHSQPHRFQQLKEEWSVFCFSSIRPTPPFLPNSHFSKFIPCAHSSYSRCC